MKNIFEIVFEIDKYFLLFFQASCYLCINKIYKSICKKGMVWMSSKNNVPKCFSVGQFFYVATSIHHIASDLV